MDWAYETKPVHCMFSSHAPLVFNFWEFVKVAMCVSLMPIADCELQHVSQRQKRRRTRITEANMRRMILCALNLPHRHNSVNSTPVTEATVGSNLNHWTRRQFKKTLLIQNILVHLQGNERSSYSTPVGIIDAFSHIVTVFSAL